MHVYATDRMHFNKMLIYSGKKMFWTVRWDDSLKILGLIVLGIQWREKSEYKLQARAYHISCEIRTQYVGVVGILLLSRCGKCIMAKSSRKLTKVKGNVKKWDRSCFCCFLYLKLVVVY
jgi:hypothetical protein